MLIARKLLDSFIDSMDATTKEDIYEMAIHKEEEAMSLMANLYEKALETTQPA